MTQEEKEENKRKLAKKADKTACKYKDSRAQNASNQHVF